MAAPRVTLKENRAGGQEGFILAMTIILILGVTAISVGTLFNAKNSRLSTGNYETKLRNFTAADGMVTLLTQEMINGMGSKYIDSTRYGTINGKLWTGITGNNVSELAAAVTANSTPNAILSSNYLGNQLNQLNCGVIWYGYIVPPFTGNYTFFSRSDDASAFYLSKDTSKIDVSRTSPICSLDKWVSSWPGHDSGASTPQALVAGKRYYFEFWVKQGRGFDIGQMGWDGPNNLSERPITGRYLSKYSSDPEWNGIFNVGGLPVKYQVQGNGTDNFNIKVEAITTKPGNASDTIVRTPLMQNVSMIAPNTAPPTTLDLPAIFYDYKADGSNPEFNQPANMFIGLRTGMVENRLTNFTAIDAAYFGRTTIGKPTKAPGYAGNRSCGLNWWFQDWFRIRNVFRYGPGDDCSVTFFNPWGQAWRNTKRKETITFKLDPSQGKNTYVFSQMGNYNTGNPATSWRGDATEFFPLDKYDNDPNNWTNPGKHNFGFCMEMHTTFTHQSGLVFEFTGDDDVWVFINNQLVIDLGGVHPAENANLVLDNLPLTFGKTYNFDFFQCERMQVNSSCRIVTNIQLRPGLGKPNTNWRRDYGSMD